MSNDADDQKWLDTLSGKAEERDDLTAIEAEAIRASLMRIAQNRPAYELSEDLFQKIVAKAKEEGLLHPERDQGVFDIGASSFLSDQAINPNEISTKQPVPNTRPSITKRWSALIAMIMSAIAFGAITMRFAMMSGMEAVRSGNAISTVDGHKKLTQSVLVRVTDPLETVGSTVAEAVRLELSFSVKPVTGGYDALIEGIVPNSYEQAKLKRILGISPSAGGDVVFQIRQKPAK